MSRRIRQPIPAQPTLIGYVTVVEDGIERIVYEAYRGRKEGGNLFLKSDSLRGLAAELVRNNDNCPISITGGYHPALQGRKSLDPRQIESLWDEIGMQRRVKNPYMI